MAQVKQEKQVNASFYPKQKDNMHKWQGGTAPHQHQHHVYQQVRRQESFSPCGFKGKECKQSFSCPKTISMKDTFDPEVQPLCMTVIVTLPVKVDADQWNE